MICYRFRRVDHTHRPLRLRTLLSSQVQRTQTLANILSSQLALAFVAHNLLFLVKYWDFEGMLVAFKFIAYAIHPKSSLKLPSISFSSIKHQSSPR